MSVLPVLPVPAVVTSNSWTPPRVHILTTQLAMKFLEKDELSNYTFQNDFMRPFVVVMRQSQVWFGFSVGGGVEQGMLLGSRRSMCP